MKLLYIALCDLCANGETGIRNKVYSQLKSLSKKFDTYLISWDNFIICTYKGNTQIEKKVLLSNADILNYAKDFVCKEGIDVVFYRYLMATPWVNKFMKDMGELGKKVIIEFPTIPYDGEFKGRVELEEDLIYRNRLKRHVRYSTNYNGLVEVYGIPSVSLHNGINIEDVSMKKEHCSHDLTLVAVAAMNFWHGYDRLIKSLGEYYQKHKIRQDSYTKVYFRLVGLGKEIPRYQDLIKEYALEEYVTIEGLKLGEDLDKIFDEADVAVGSLGASRKNMKGGSEIKTKEYCARGIPMILGNEDLAFPGELPFIHRVPNDESPIDIDGIVAFYKRFKSEGNQTEIRAYAEKYLTWDVQFQKMYQFMGM